MYRRCFHSSYKISSLCSDMHYVPEYRAVSRLIDVYQNPESIFIHPNYDSKTMLNDIAIIKLPNPISLTATDKTSFLRPICLPNGEIPAVGQNCFVSGWGNLKDAVNLRGNNDQLETSVLQEVVIPIQDVSKCKKKPSDLGAIHPDYHPGKFRVSQRL